MLLCVCCIVAQCLRNACLHKALLSKAKLSLLAMGCRPGVERVPPI